MYFATFTSGFVNLMPQLYAGDCRFGVRGSLYPMKPIFTPAIMRVQ